MTFAGLIARNAFRNRFRTALTIAGMAAAVVAFVFLRTVIAAWYVGVEASAKDRLATRHKTSITLPLPLTYFAKVRDAIPGVAAVTYANWCGMENPKKKGEFFGNFAVDGDTYFKVYDEVVIDPAQLAEWKADPAGAIVGEVLARKNSWKVGDTVVLTGSIYPGDWKFTIRGLYTTTKKSFDKSTFFFHWKYLNEGVEASRKELIGFLGIRVDDPAVGPRVAKAVDDMFANSEAETLTESERAFNLSFVGMLSAILTAIDIVSGVIVLIMMMIVGNTIAMGVRERTNEYGVMRAIGFQPHHLASFVVAETALVAVVGGVIGVGLAVPLVNLFGAVIEENVGSFFPYFFVATHTMLTAFAIALVVGLLAAALPAYQAARLPIVQALRKVG